jgi:2,5-diketo-D-gluconate reductase A
MQWLALERLYKEGRCKAIGVSNYTAAHLDELCTSSWMSVRPAVNQFEIHPLLQQRDIVAATRKHGIVVEAYSSLAQGDARLLGSKIIKDIAAAHGKTCGQVILRWAVQQGFVVIPKTSSSQRAAENLDVLDWTLSEAEMSAIDSLECGEAGRQDWNPHTIK